MTQPAGPAWCDQFPGSASLDDLIEPFRSKAAAFIDALRDAGAAVTVNATYRPPERAYLMHYCCLIAGYRDQEKVFHQISPNDVDPFSGVDIDWSCGGDIGAARAAAVAMCQKYNITYPAALISNHTLRRAIDMIIQFKGSIRVLDARGIEHSATCQSDLWPVGASYGVIKLPRDLPHWSSDGR